MKKLLTIFIAFFLLLSAGCNSANKSSRETDQSNKLFTNENYVELTSSPDKFEGAKIDIKGKVFRLEKDSKGVYFQMWANAEKSDGNITVAYGNPKFKLNNDDYVAVKGTVGKEIKGENAFGAEVTSVSVMANSVKTISPIDVEAPTQNTVIVKQAQTQNGLSITVNKIEFAEKEARIYVTVKNATGANANIYSFDTKVIQSNTQIKDNYPTYENPDELQSDIASGITETGVIVFKPIDYSKKAVKIIAKGSTDNYDMKFNPYVFNIKW